MNQETKIEIKIFKMGRVWRVEFKSEPMSGNAQFANESDAYKYAIGVLAMPASQKMGGVWRVEFKSEPMSGNAQFANESDAYKYAIGVLAMPASQKMMAGATPEQPGIDTLKLSQNRSEWKEQIEEFLNYPDHVEIHNWETVYAVGEYRGRIKNGIFYQEK